jgi:hypothetical protein
MSAAATSPPPSWWGRVGSSVLNRGVKARSFCQNRSGGGYEGDESKRGRPCICTWSYRWFSFFRYEDFSLHFFHERWMMLASADYPCF